MNEVATAYNGGRSRISELVRDLGDGTSVTVPACPEWTIKDVVAHLTGICADIIAGRLDRVATEPWTQAQVDARRDSSIAEVIDEWDDVGARIEEMLPSFPDGPDRQLVFDLTTHEHDIRGALGSPGARDSDGVQIGVDFGIPGLVNSVSSRGLATLRVAAGTQHWTTGEDEPSASLRLDPFDLFRALTGRRSLDQVRAFDWTGDAEAYLPAFEWGPFHPASTDIIE